jgi:IS4 transposase
LAQKKARRKSRKNGYQQLQSETLFYAQFVMVLSTFPEEDFTSAQVLQCYRYRWQIELVFKRFKQIAQLGHLPKYHDESAKAWLYGKLFVALLTEKLIQHARAVSPWGYELQVQTSSQSMA